MLLETVEVTPEAVGHDEKTVEKTREEGSDEAPAKVPVKIDKDLSPRGE